MMRFIKDFLVFVVTFGIQRMFGYFNIIDTTKITVDFASFVITYCVVYVIFFVGIKVIKNNRLKNKYRENS